MNEQAGGDNQPAGYAGDVPDEDAPIRKPSPTEAEAGTDNSNKSYWGMGGKPDDGDEDEENDEDEEDEKDEGDEGNGEDEGEEDVVAEYETVPSDETDFSGDIPL